MKLTIVTNVWHGEYDEAEFLPGHTVLKSDDYYWTVTEELVLNPASVVTIAPERE